MKKTFFVTLFLAIFLTSIGSNYLSFISRIVRSKIEHVIDKSNVDRKCTSDLKSFISDLHKPKLWALKMLDATGKIHPGIMYGNIHQTGNYDQCLEIEEHRKGGTITGQYCSVILLPNSNITDSVANYFKLENALTMLDVPNTAHLPDSFMRVYKIVVGLCIPKSCSIKHLQRIWNYAEDHFEIPFHMVFEDFMCTHKDKPLLPHYSDYYIWLFFAVVFGVVLASTVYDVYLQKHGRNSEIFTSFSLYTNAKKLLSTTQNNNDLICLHGIKVLSMMWIVFCHMILLKHLVSNTNTLIVLTEFRQTFLSGIFVGGHLAVDTFLAISGLLLVYVQMTYSERIKISLTSFYLNRLVRIVPALLAMILIYSGVLKHLSGGPLWSIIWKRMASPCQSTWWATLLFISNYLKVSNQCLIQTWYLSVDTQLYILAPIILFSINKYPTKVINVMLTACAISFTYTYIMVLLKKFGYIISLGLEEDNAFYVYNSTISRLPGWLIGVFYGYLLYQGKKDKTSDFQKFNQLLMMFSLLMMFLLVFSHFLFLRYEFNVTRSALHNTFARPLWAFSVCNVIYCCCNGDGGIVNDFLSHPIFRILSKLTYSMYLSHFAVIMAIGGYQKQAGYVGYFQVFYEFWGTLVLVLIASTILCLCFEAPFISIMKQLEKSAPKIQTSREETGPKASTIAQNYTTWIQSTIYKKENVKVE